MSLLPSIFGFCLSNMNMNINHNAFLVIIFVLTQPSYLLGKTVSGVFNTYLAQAGRGQYVTSFAFHGDAVLHFSVNETGTDARLHLFVSEDWRDAAGDDNCQRRLAKARELIAINETSDSRDVSHFVYPRIWHIVYSDSFTCDPSRPVAPVEKPNFIQYTLTLLNPDSIGNATEHFGDQETGLLKFYQLMLLIYFVVACVVAPQLVQTITKGGPMQLLIQLLTASMTLQFVAALVVMVHLHRYSHDGHGSPLLELFSEFLDVLSQFTMLFMLLSLSLGWSLSSAHSVCRSSHLKEMSAKPAARVVAVLGLVQGGLLMWEQCSDVYVRLYHAQRSYVGISLVLLRITLAIMFGVRLRGMIRSERSSLKRQFYSTFTKLCMMWFLCYPLVLLATKLVSEYMRYKLTTMGVLMCQSAAGVMLYRLFLSRSLFWEVSSLSSSLPLRFDSRFGMRSYS